MSIFRLILVECYFRFFGANVAGLPWDWLKIMVQTGGIKHDWVWPKQWLVNSKFGSTNGISKCQSGFIRKVEIGFFDCNRRCLTRLRFCLAEILFGLMACCIVWIMSFGLGQGRSLVSWGCTRQYKYKVKYINHINRGFGSRDQNWGSCKYAQTSLRTLLYGSPVLCVVWFCEIRRPVNFWWGRVGPGRI